MPHDGSLPILPESSPFSPSQRAFLNGVFAALASTNVPLLRVAPESVKSAVPPEPWHDAALVLDERLALAKDRPFADKLMAAMAQLDCGACGYVCRTYADALALGAERDTARCGPGGAATAKVLRAKLRERPQTAAPVQATPQVAQNIVGVQFVAATSLHAPGAGKDTRHVVLRLGDSGLTYEPGDALGVLPENCPELVAQILAALHATGNEPVRLADGAEMALFDALRHRCAIHRVDESHVEMLAAVANPADRARLRALVVADALDGLDLLDLLTEFPSARPSPQEVVSALAPLQPRLYSISSSPRAQPGEVHLTVGVVRDERDGRMRHGVASTFLADRVAEGQKVQVFVHPSKNFSLPRDPATPVIMVGPGTGIAPFRAFLQERQATGGSGRNWLFFGHQTRATDFLYHNELSRALEVGHLTRLDLAFSRDQAAKLYVQDRMHESAAELWRWMQDGAHFYVCGDARRMAADVDQMLQRIVAEQGGLDATAAKAYTAQLAREGRYQRDVY